MRTTTSLANWIPTALLAIVVLLAPSSVDADMVAPPPSGVCPAGTHPMASHGMDPSMCILSSCSTEADCTAAGDVCAELPLCTYNSCDEP